MVKLDIDVLSKAEAPTAITLLGMINEPVMLQLAKALSPMLVIAVLMFTWPEQHKGTEG